MHRHNWDYCAVLLALLLSCGVASAQGIPSAVIGTPSSGGGGGGSVSITAATPNLVFTPSPLTGTGTVGTTNAQNSPADGGSHSYTVVAGDITKEVILAGTFTAAAVPQATGSFGAGSSFTLVTRGAITATSTTSTINGIAGATGIKLGANQFSQWDSDGTNWIVGIGVAQPAAQTGATLLHDDMTWGAVSLTAQISGILPVANGGTALSSGTSGGVLAYTASGTLASSGALTANLPVIGGGAGAVPSVGSRTGNTTAFATSTGSLTNGDCAKWDASGNIVDAGSACGSGSGGGGMFGYSDNGLTLTAGTRFVPIYGSGTPSTTEADYATKSPSATTATNLQVNLSADPGAGQTLVVTLRKAGSDTALTCTVTGGSGVVCQDLTHSVSVAQNDLIDWKVVTTGTFVATPSVTILANNGTSNVGVTSIATTSPITGGTITTTGTIACATCTTSASALTNHAPVIGGGSQAESTVAAMTNGQILIGSTGSDPVPAALTAGSNITITPGAGSVTIAASGGSGSSFLTGNQPAGQASNITHFCGVSGTNIGTGGGGCATTHIAQDVSDNARTFGVIGGVSGSGFRASSTSAPSAGQTYTLTLLVNGSAPASGPVCTISGTNTTCSDTTHSATTAAGDTLEMQVVSSATATGSIPISWGISFQ